MGTRLATPPQTENQSTLRYGSMQERLTCYHDGFGISSQTVLQEICQHRITIWDVGTLVAMVSSFISQSRDNSTETHKRPVNGASLLQPVSLSSCGTCTFTGTKAYTPDYIFPKRRGQFSTMQYSTSNSMYTVSEILITVSEYTCQLGPQGVV